MSNSSINSKSAFSFLIILFFMWGFITCLNDLLIPELKEVFDLTYWQAMLVQTAFFGAYFVVSLIYFFLSISYGDPIGKLGYQRGLVFGLILCGVGCLLFFPAAEKAVYAYFLGALFVLASGITIIQIAANPYVAILGSPKTASSRLNLAQGLNSLGYTIAPIIGGILIFGSTSSGASSVKVPYIGLAVAFFLLAFVFGIIKLPVLTNAEKIKRGTSLFKYPFFVGGLIAIFVYVGGEVAVGSILINYLGLEDVVGFEKHTADKFLSFYWGGLMIGRFMGAISLSNIEESGKKWLYMILAAVAGTGIIYLVSWRNWITGEQLLNLNSMLPFIAMVAVNFIAFRLGASKPGKMIGIFSLVVMTLLLGTIFGAGSVGMWAIIGIGLFNSIMWSNIFTLSIEGLEEHTSQASSLLVMMIVGGAILPPLQGALADAYGVRASFALIILCYAYLCYYGFWGHKLGRDRLKAQKSV